MATWPDITEATAAIGDTNISDAGEVERCLAAAIDFLSHRCYITYTDDEPPEAIVPDGVRRACVMLTARLFRRRLSVEGVAGFGDLGAVRVMSVDPDIEQLIAPHRDWGIA